MKKILLILVVLFSINLMAMSKKEFSSNIKIQNAFEEASEKKFNIDGNKISNESFEINFTFLEDKIILNIKNKSTEIIYVDWNKTKYIGLDEYEMRLYNFSQKDSGEFVTMKDSVIQPEKDTTVEVVPIRNMKFVGERIAVIEKVLLDSTSVEVKNKKRDFSQINIPVRIGNTSKKFVIKSVITFSPRSI